jgi:2-polyprenyl-3-methyl-5-hydroxy-6-metoxy-1,4-benzoquinol methylase
VIAFAACVADEEKYARCAVPGLSLVAEDDSLVMQAGDEASIFTAYNEVLDAVREREDLEALVLLHEDTEILDPEFCAKVRALMADPDVAVAGVVGARGVRGLAWWEGQCFGRVAETRGVIDFGGGTHEVETVDGLLMVLSPWAVANLRFDDRSFSGFDAYDADICFQARAAGRKVVVAPLDVAHRHSREGTERATADGGSFQRNDAAWRAKWLAPDGAASKAAGVGDAAKGETYFEFDRPELRALVPAGARRVLDVGCGAGALGAALKRERDIEVVGLEGFEDAAARARERLDDALCVDLDRVEELPFEQGAFDAMVFGDVLEHLRDPHRLLRALRPYLADDGVILCSIPNVKHWTVLFPLLVQDRWRYEDAGLLDRTHIHFFTLEEIGQMLEETGFDARQVGVNDLAPLPDELQPLVDVAVRFGAEREETAARLGAYQYLVLAGKKS